MNEKKETTKKKRAGRSPGYPGIDIQMALKRAEELYNKAQHYSSNIDVTAGHWGYNPGSGMAIITIAALKKYGLIIDEGSGKDRAVRLTELALDIIKDTREDKSERNENILKSALKPKIHEEMFDKYGFNLPSDANLLYELERNRSFTPNGAKDFISQYKRTLSHIRNLKPDIPHKSPGDSELQDDETKSLAITPAPASSTGSTSIPNVKNIKNVEIPIPTDPWPILTASFPMSEDTWELMIKMLEVMKPALVQESTEEKLLSSNYEYEDSK